MQEIKIRSGFIRDVDGIWHRIDTACRFYIKAERRSDRYQCQVLGEFEQHYTKYLIEFTGVIEGKRKAQEILDNAFLED